MSELRSRLQPITNHKNKFPSCWQFIYVRPNSLDLQRILVTEKFPSRIDDEWAILCKSKDAIRTFNISDI